VKEDTDELGMLIEGLRRAILTLGPDDKTMRVCWEAWIREFEQVQAKRKTVQGDSECVERASMNDIGKPPAAVDRVANVTTDEREGTGCTTERSICTKLDPVQCETSKEVMEPERGHVNKGKGQYQGFHTAHP